MILDLSELGEVERWILVKQHERLLAGQKIYGPWKLGARDYFYEAVLEVLDRNNYLSAEDLRKENGVPKAPSSTSAAGV